MSESEAEDEPKTRRKEMRAPALLSGKLVFGVHDMTGDCTIRNLTDGGAKIRTSLASVLPQEFWLISLRHACAYRARIAWRRGEELGLSFQSKHDLQKDDDRSLFMVRRVWLQAAGR